MDAKFKTRLNLVARVERGEREIPDIIAIETIDEDITAEIQEVDGGSGHRHLGSSGSDHTLNEMDRRWQKQVTEMAVDK
ncbi:hypothetical protein V6N12_068865 [Hibiscus sabdariffa]|uniref:Uncharacterized protein n=1 Tax=Hibiscus sabdariffa TaxID=183260 RepID=A0ABR2CA29_9ROSI